MLLGADGRTTHARRLKDLQIELLDEIGGDDASPSQRAAARRLAALHLRCEQQEAAMLSLSDEFDGKLYNGLIRQIIVLHQSLGLDLAAVSTPRTEPRTVAEFIRSRKIDTQVTPKATRQFKPQRRDPKSGRLLEPENPNEIEDK